jgi:hypothetical protein
MPLLVPLLEPVGPHAQLQRRGSLLPRSMASQYSTAKTTTPAGRGSDPRAAGRQEERNADASGLRAGELDVKPHGTRHNRTSSAASADPVRSARSSRGGNSRFFRNSPLPDGPRPPRAEIIPLPCAFAHAPGSGRIARVGAACPARWPDTAGPPAAATRGGPPPCRPRYSTAKEDETARTTSRTPSADKSAHDNAPGLAMTSINDHVEPRTLASANSRRSSPGSGASTPLRGVLDRSLPVRPTAVQPNHIPAVIPPVPGDGPH